MGPPRFSTAASFKVEHELPVASECAVIHRVRRCLVDSVRDAIGGERRIVILVSGGLDSSAIAGIFADLKARGEWPVAEPDHPGATGLVQCFTLAFDSAEYDESGERTPAVYKRPPFTNPTSHCPADRRAVELAYSGCKGE